MRHDRLAANLDDGFGKDLGGLAHARAFAPAEDGDWGASSEQARGRRRALRSRVRAGVALRSFGELCQSGDEPSTKLPVRLDLDLDLDLADGAVRARLRHPRSRLASCSTTPARRWFIGSLRLPERGRGR